MSKKQKHQNVSLIQIQDGKEKKEKSERQKEKESLTKETMSRRKSTNPQNSTRESSDSDVPTCRAACALLFPLLLKQNHKLMSLVTNLIVPAEQSFYPTIMKAE